MATIEERVTKLENELTLMQCQLGALDTNVGDLAKKLDKRLETFVNAVHERFNGLEKLVRDTHSENGRNRGADD